MSSLPTTPSTAHDPIVISEDRVIRYTFRERVIHWLAALSYIYLLLSGLAFYTPYLYWMASILGGGPTARFWHPWFGLVFAVVMFFMDVRRATSMTKLFVGAGLFWLAILLVFLLSDYLSRGWLPILRWL